MDDEAAASVKSAIAERRARETAACRSLDESQLGAELRLLGACLIASLAVRLLVIALSPDSEVDAYGHFRIAQALVAEPHNLHVHWVWLPAPHYVMACLVKLGATHEALRVLATLLFAASPLLLFFYARGRGESAASVAALGATLWALAPVSNRIATTAQPETAFALLVFGAVWALESRRAGLAGTLLAIGCLTRYECWAAVILLALVAPFSRDRRIFAVALAVPVATVLGWILLRRAADGNWLWFVWHTWSFSERVREEVGLPFLVDAVLVPVFLPLAGLGPLLLLAPWRLRRIVTVPWAAPAGVVVMLGTTYLLRGIPALDRYFVVLVPFLSLAAAHTLRARALPKWLQTWARRVTLGGLGAMTLAHLVVAIVRGQALAEGLAH